MQRFYSSADIEERVRFLEQQDSAPRRASTTDVQREPHFCSGCPHNTSTRVPEGSRAVGGIGCHYMAAWMDRDTVTYTQMGGEGATWIGQAPFTETQARVPEPRRRHLRALRHRSRSARPSRPA